MSVMTKLALSGSSTGRFFVVNATAGSGDLIHTTGAAGTKDIIYLWASNRATTTNNLSLRWADTVDLTRTILYTFPPDSLNLGENLVPIIPGIHLDGGGLELRAINTVADSIRLLGFVNRISGTTGKYRLVSISTDNKTIKITTTGDTGDLVHTAAATALDEMWLWCYNRGTVARFLTIRIFPADGNAGSIRIFIPPRVGLLPVMRGFIVTGSIEIRAFADVADDSLHLLGYVNRIGT